jgi:hypothetical protein
MAEIEFDEDARREWKAVERELLEVDAQREATTDPDELRALTKRITELNERKSHLATRYVESVEDE